MSHSHLTIEDRREISTLRSVGCSQSVIAHHLQKDQSTISREITRNQRSDRQYLPGYAQKKAKARRLLVNQRFRKLGTDTSLTAYVVDKLQLYWSPEQIVGRMDIDRQPFRCSHTAIYEYLYSWRPDLTHCLRFHHNRYRRKYGTRQREAARKAGEKKRLIDQRSEEINQRLTLGHWEGDTVVGKERTVRILTHTERKSGYLVAAKLDQTSAALTRAATVTCLSQLTGVPVCSLTYDNGTEFQEYELLEKELAIPIFFAHPYHSWERGTNENTNGLLRQFFPKGSYFATITLEQLQQAQDLINQRPRKRLNYLSPVEYLVMHFGG